MSDSSAMLFIVLFLLLFLIFMGYMTKARIYNLFAVAPAMYIALAYINSISIVVLMIGIIIYQLYLTVKVVG